MSSLGDADQRWMAEALLQAKQSSADGEVPIGACVVVDGECVGVGHNQPCGSNDPTAHAEVQALRMAATSQSNYRLENATLYVTLEPCLMCVGAMVQSRISRLVYGASDPKKSFLANLDEWFKSQAINHRFEVEGGVLAEDCSELLKEFFKDRR